MESGSNIFRRSLLLIAGIFIIGIGVALSIRSDLGITPITCPPLVFSLRFPAITVGQCISSLWEYRLHYSGRILRRNS